LPRAFGENDVSLRCQFQVQIVPIGNSGFDYPAFPSPIPFLIFFTNNCGLNRFMLFEPNQPVDIVLPYTLGQITRYANIYATVSMTRQQVYIRISIHGSNSSVDGTKLKANASRHKAMSDDRIKKAELELKAQIDALMAKAKATDEAEKKEPELDIAAEIRRRETRLAVIRALAHACHPTRFVYTIIVFATAPKTMDRLDKFGISGSPLNERKSWPLPHTLSQRRCCTKQITRFLRKVRPRPKPNYSKHCSTYQKQPGKTLTMQHAVSTPKATAYCGVNCAFRVICPRITRRAYLLKQVSSLS
jgi:hypothetical protein